MESRRNIFIFWTMAILTILFFLNAMYIGYQYFFNQPSTLPFLVVYKNFLIFWTVFGIAISVAGAILIVLEVIPRTIARSVVAALSAYEILLVLYVWGELCNMPWTSRLAILGSFYLTWLITRHLYREYGRHARDSD